MYASDATVALLFSRSAIENIDAERWFLNGSVFFFVGALRVRVIKFNDFTVHSARRVYIIQYYVTRASILNIYDCVIQVDMTWTLRREWAGFWQRYAEDLPGRSCDAAAAAGTASKTCRQSLFFSFIFFKTHNCYLFVYLSPRPFPIKVYRFYAHCGTYIMLCCRTTHILGKNVKTCIALIKIPLRRFVKPQIYLFFFSNFRYFFRRSEFYYTHSFYFMVFSFVLLLFQQNWSRHHKTISCCI